jgi:hypothetical protein
LRSRRIVAWVTPDEYNALERLAAKEGTSLSTFARRVLTRLLRRRS